MSIKLKAVESLINIGKYTGQYRYVLKADLYNKLSAAKVIREASTRSGLSRGMLNASWDVIGEVLRTWATEGHSVAIPGLGTMRFGVRAKSVANVNDVATDLVKMRKVIFTPDSEIKQELEQTSISITCYDRNGIIVKRVLSADDGDVENPDEPTDETDDEGTADAGDFTE